MATNYDQTGDIWTGPAPEDLVSGQAFMVGNQIAVAQIDALTGEMVTAGLRGVWQLPASGGAVAAGGLVNFDPALGEVYGGLLTAGDFGPVGFCWAAYAGTEGSMLVSINKAHAVLGS